MAAALSISAGLGQASQQADGKKFYLILEDVPLRRGRSEYLSEDPGTKLLMDAIKTIPGSVTILAQTDGYASSGKPYAVPEWTKDALERSALVLDRQLTITESGVIFSGLSVADEDEELGNYNWRDWMLNYRNEMDRISSGFVNVLDLGPVGRRSALQNLFINRNERLLSLRPIWVKADFSIDLRRADNPDGSAISLGLAPKTVPFPDPEPARLASPLLFKPIAGTALQFPKPRVMFLRNFLREAGKALNKSYAVDRSMRDLPLIVSGGYDHEQVLAVLRVFTEVRKPAYIVRDESELSQRGTPAIDALVSALERQATDERRQLIQTLRGRGSWTIKEISELSPIFERSLSSRIYQRWVSEWGDAPVIVSISAQLLVGPIGDMTPISFAPRPSR